MEWLAPRIDEPFLLQLSGKILRPDLPPSEVMALRQQVYQPSFRWQALAGFAGGQDILPPLIWSLRRNNLLPAVPKSLPPEKCAGFVTTRLAEVYHRHIARRTGLRAQLHEAVAALNAAGVTPLVLKGAKYLLGDGDGWEAARPMRDIDLLIPADQAASSMRALRQIGYLADAPTGLQSQHLPELRREGEYGVIELHLEAMAPAGRRFMSTETVWQHAVAANSATGNAFMLPAHWQALHAMLHHQASDDGDRLRNLACKPLWEFTWLAQSIGETGWAEMVGQLGASGGIDLLASWCVQAGVLYGLKLPVDLPVSAAAQKRAEETIAEAQAPEGLRRGRFLLRQLGRGFSRHMMASRYDVPEAQVGLWLRAKHLLFLLRRYRGQFGARLLGQR